MAMTTTTTTKTTIPMMMMMMSFFSRGPALPRVHVPQASPKHVG
jgi:hypothetical protein